MHCSNCNFEIKTDGGHAPKFCSNCGANLQEAGSTTRPADQTGETMTIQPKSSGLPKVVFVDDPEVPTQIGPYKIGDRLGQGGMGTVFSATHQETGRRVAIKILSGQSYSSEAVERFKREGQIAASISHPRSTFVYDAGEYNGQLYIAMELMGGGTLKDVVREKGALPVSEAVDHILDMIDGLIAAHRVGVIHRDLKPSNCFVDEDGRVKIGDYGLSKSVVSANAGLTQTGAFMGTPQFAAPEQIKCIDLDERTDIYAVGCTLFYLLTGQAPFSGNAAQVIASIASDKAPRLISLDRTIPRDLDAAVAKSLEKDPDKRQVNLLELRESLLPFSSSGASMANVGRRMAAYYIDMAIAFLISQTFGMVFTFVVMFSDSSLGDRQRFIAVQLTAVVIQVGTAVLYFAFSESRFGKTIGKWLMGLRVVRSNSERPALWQACARSLILPGLSMMASVIPTIIMTQNLEGEQNPLDIVFFSQIYGLISWVVFLVCVSTMRVRNGLRGLHEIISGTRTVEISQRLSEKKIDRVGVTAPRRTDPKTFQQFEFLGRVDNRKEGKVSFAKDSGLDRDVWVFEDCRIFENSQDAERRESVKRPSRQRLLTLANDENEVCVFEAVRGVPLITLIESGRKFHWPQLRTLFGELAFELAQGVKEQTLPKQLELDQVWVTESGELKLVECSFYRARDEGAVADEFKAFELFQNLLVEVRSRIPVPGHVMDILERMEKSNKGLEALYEAAEALRDTSDMPAKWARDDRAAVWAATTGLEYLPFLSFSFLALLLLHYVGIGISNTLIACLVIGNYATVVGLCTFFRGGPVFHLSGIEVRTKSGEPASALRCGIRGAIAWLPFILLNATLLSQTVQVSFDGKNGSAEVDWFMISILIVVALGAFLIKALGSVISILNPPRGIQDLLSGTLLTRR